MNEEEKKAIEKQFERNLELLVREKFPLTATAIVSAEQPMILLFKELIHRIEKREYELDKKDKIIDKIYDFCRRELAFEKRLKREKRKPDEFNQGRFYVCENIKAIITNKVEEDIKE